ncbi:MAG TPA: hypothetical protein VKW06_00490 [Candidatus Angelobacter sp.]|nr:hypothetical protein [Candidatus Angelobacter sp.]
MKALKEIIAAMRERADTLNSKHSAADRWTPEREAERAEVARLRRHADDLERFA